MIKHPVLVFVSRGCLPSYDDPELSALTAMR